MSGNVNAEGSLANTMTDLMTSLAVIFILLLVVYINYSYEETRQGSSNAKESLKTRLSILGIRAQDDPNDPLALVVRVEDEKLRFDTNQAILKPQGKTYIHENVPRILSVLCDSHKKNKVNADVESMLIQGFTDSDGNDELNLALSQDRALTVLKESLTQYQPNDYRRICLLNMASTNGLGERLRLGSSGQTIDDSVIPGREDKVKSRRVEFKIRVKSFEQRQKLLGNV
jgi:outer membrane protein OmpA-like peptidoglycan-associated protein